MNFDKSDDSELWLPCSFAPEDRVASFNNEDDAERRHRIERLRDQIRTGTYRPSIGEIAINLVKGSMNPDSFR
ncbi:flagellar biosynthesis anti-sigma factor FlgM [Maridesulfovibrio sp. FT414]|uniref:flagellar biosynthesis anti-sigma factor FlgM n=1 Tax=Maridesulfovibrio sp. FT414 TaxID=2979469 RepID=UPI003D80467B